MSKITKSVFAGAFFGATIVAVFGVLVGYSGVLLGGHHGTPTHGDAISLAMIFTLIFAIPAAVIGGLAGAMIGTRRQNGERFESQGNMIAENEADIEREEQFFENDAIQ